jgi:ribosomal protein L20A (L18A)
MAEDIQVKIYRISGKYQKVHQNFTFTKFVRALNEKQALDSLLSKLTSNRMMRRKINIIEIKEIPISECTDPYTVALSKMQ